MKELLLNLLVRWWWKRVKENWDTSRCGRAIAWLFGGILFYCVIAYILYLAIFFIGESPSQIYDWWKIKDQDAMLIAMPDVPYFNDADNFYQFIVLSKLKNAVDVNIIAKARPSSCYFIKDSERNDILIPGEKEKYQLEILENGGGGGLFGFVSGFSPYFQNKNVNCDIPLEIEIAINCGESKTLCAKEVFR